jgi:hypothetical protein
MGTRRNLLVDESFASTRFALRESGQAPPRPARRRERARAASSACKHAWCHALLDALGGLIKLHAHAPTIGHPYLELFDSCLDRVSAVPRVNSAEEGYPSAREVNFPANRSLARLCHSRNRWFGSAGKARRLRGAGRVARGSKSVSVPWAPRPVIAPTVAAGHFIRASPFGNCRPR